MHQHNQVHNWGTDRIWTDKYKGTVHALFEGIDPGVIMALGFISVEFPEFVGTTVKIPDHAWFFRLMIRFRLRSGIAKTEVGSGITGHGYIYIRQIIEISTIVKKHARVCTSA